jgi:hypothetical protein
MDIPWYRFLDRDQGTLPPNQAAATAVPFSPLRLNFSHNSNDQRNSVWSLRNHRIQPAHRRSTLYFSKIILQYNFKLLNTQISQTSSVFSNKALDVDIPGSDIAHLRGDRVS